MKTPGQKLFSALLWVVLFGLVGYQAYQYYRAIPCLTPIEYKVGTLDPRFGVSESGFKADIAEAAGLWSTAAGKNLFMYNPNAQMTVNLIYDDRQKITNQEQVLNSNIDATKDVAGSVKQQYTDLTAKYTAALAAYTSGVAQFNQKQNDYNALVEQYNSQGGAPPQEYRALQAQKASLAGERTVLEQQRQEVNSLGSEINALIDKYNLLVSHINANVDAINNDGLTGTQFEEGVFISESTGKRINIYQFNSKVYFIRVLAHELGHSLGLQHNAGQDSIMSPINQSKSLALSPQDLAALTALCPAK